MWNKWLALKQEPAYKRLGIALCISALLHFFLVGNFYKLLPENKPELHTIEARLQMPKVVAKPEATLPAETPPKPEKPAKAKPVKAPKPVEPDASEEVKPTEEPLPVENTAPPPIIVSSDATPSPRLSEPLATSGGATDTAQNEPQQPIDEGMVINENAYQYVETTFNVSTKIDGSPEGKATMTYNLIDGQHYQIISVAKAGGLAALVLSELLQTSEGALTKTGLQPNKFTYNYGDKASKSRLATFDWQTKTVVMETAAGVQTEQLPDEAQDLLSFMYQFMYVPPLHKMQIPIVNGRSLRTYDYSFEGESSIPLPMGEVNTIHIQHSNNENEEKIELWLAVDYQYLPVKILKIDKNGKIYEFTASRINKERPLADAVNKNTPASP
jgi:Protein of unknown function (DUF3108)